MEKQKKQRHAFECREYKVWANLKQKTTNPSASGYKSWGGKGIKLFDDWHKDFVTFLNGMRAAGYTPGQVLILKDKTKDIEPGNIEFVSPEIARCIKKPFVMYQGKQINIREVAKELGTSVSTIYDRMKQNWSYREVVGKAPRSEHPNKTVEVITEHPLVPGLEVVHKIQVPKKRSRPLNPFEHYLNTAESQTIKNSSHGNFTWGFIG